MILHSVLFWPACPFRGLVLVYYYTGICDVTVTKWNFKLGLVLPFKNAGQEKTECTSHTRCIFLLSSFNTPRILLHSEHYHYSSQKSPPHITCTHEWVIKGRCMLKAFKGWWKFREKIRKRTLLFTVTSRTETRVTQEMYPQAGENKRVPAK